MGNFLLFFSCNHVCKDKFDVCLTVIDTLQKVTIKASRSFTNNSKDFKELAQWVKTHHKEPKLPIVYLMEATGIYYENLAWFLHHLNCHVTVILPKKPSIISKALGLKVRMTKLMPVGGLAFMAAQQNLEVWKPISPQIEELKALTRHYQTLQNEKNGF